MRILGWLLLALLPAATLQATEIEISAGAEYLRWEEVRDGGGTLREESGLRQFVGIVGTNRIDPVWSVDFGGRVQSATVDYDGESQQGSEVSSQSDHRGYYLELGLQRLLSPMQSRQSKRWLLRFALGHERWRRGVQDARLTDDTLEEGYVQRFATNYATLAARHERVGLWGFEAGVRFPFNSRSDLSPAGEDYSTKPEGELSLFAGMQVVLAANWQLALGYDGYRFARSDSDEAGRYQPESSQDSVSATLRYRF